MSTPRKSTVTARAQFVAKWAHKREACVAALRAGWSVYAVVRAYEVTERMVRIWHAEERIPPCTGPKRPMPEVGQILT